MSRNLLKGDGTLYNGRQMLPQSAASSTPPPAKKKSKWSDREDKLIIELRGQGMKWDDVAKRLQGRSAISCRLHYQNYLERRSKWDEERKNKLARLYDRSVPPLQQGKLIFAPKL